MKSREYRIGKIRRQIYSANISVAGIVIFLLGGFSLLQAQTPVQTNPLGDKDNYRIGVGDILKILVLKQDILSQDNVRVGNDGTIRLPMLEAAVPVACKTESELSAEITNRYKKYLLNPQVYVAVKEFNANPIAVGGAVIAPGIFQLKRPMRLLEILAFVNGPALNAGQSVQIIRSLNANRCGQSSSEKLENQATDESSDQEIISLALTDVMKGSENSNPFLQGGDIIRVPEAEIKQAFIIGNVKSAVTVNLKEPVTLSKAIAMAGGVSSGAKIDKIKISRQAPNSLAKSEIFINLKEINKANKEDIFLQPNDVVDVPGPSGSRKFLKDLIRTVIPAVTRVPVIIP
jgi:polysaccharide biosynthesis/export protein